MADPPGGSELRVLIAPWIAGQNPYLPLLAGGLEAHGVRVERVGGTSWSELDAAFEGSDPPRLLHLQWHHGFLVARGRGIGASLRRSHKFFGLLRRLRRRGIGIVWTVHNVTHHERERAGLEIRACRRLARLAHRLIVHCEAARAEVAAAYRAPRDRIDVVPHGHYIDAYPPKRDRAEARRRVGLASDGLVLLQFGQLREYKGVPDLLAALDADGTGDVTLVLAGEVKSPELAGLLQRRAAADPRLRLELGFASDGRLADLIDASDAVVLPYRRSLTSGSAMLAGSRGRALIAPRTGCMGEMAGPGAVLYGPGPDGLAGAIRTARGEDLDALGARFLERIRAVPWERVGSLTRAVYESARAAAAR